MKFFGKGHVSAADLPSDVTLTPLDVGSVVPGAPKRSLVKVISPFAPNGRDPKTVTGLSTTNPAAKAVFIPPNIVEVSCIATQPVDADFDFSGDAT